jgi:hypothetical protein
MEAGDGSKIVNEADKADEFEVLDTLRVRTEGVESEIVSVDLETVSSASETVVEESAITSARSEIVSVDTESSSVASETVSEDSEITSGGEIVSVGNDNEVAVTVNVDGGDTVVDGGDTVVDGGDTVIRSEGRGGDGGGGGTADMVGLTVNERDGGDGGGTSDGVDSVSTAGETGTTTGSGDAARTADSSET